MSKLIAIGVIGLLGIYVYYSKPQSTQTSQGGGTLLQGVAGPTPQPSRPPLDKSPQMQQKRQDIIQRLLNERIFIKVETPGTLPRVSVGPRFYNLDFDDKQTFVSVVYAYHFTSQDDGMVRLMDGRTNKSIGSFTRDFGLKLD